MDKGENESDNPDQDYRLLPISLANVLSQFICSLVFNIYLHKRIQLRNIYVHYTYKHSTRIILNGGIFILLVTPTPVLVYFSTGFHNVKPRLHNSSTSKISHLTKQTYLSGKYIKKI